VNLFESKTTSQGNAWTRSRGDTGAEGKCAK
jgi:hypothetical protein